MLDSWAVVAFFEDEPSADRVEEILLTANRSDTVLMMCVVNVGEVWYSRARTHSESKADEAVLKLRELGVKFIDADWELTRQAAAFKAKGRLAYADCYAAALAKLRKGELVTGDPELKQLEQDVKIIWI